MLRSFNTPVEYEKKIVASTFNWFFDSANFYNYISDKNVGLCSSTIIFRTSLFIQIRIFKLDKLYFMMNRLGLPPSSIPLSVPELAPEST